MPTINIDGFSGENFQAILRLTSLTTTLLTILSPKIYKWEPL